MRWIVKGINDGGDFRISSVLGKKILHSPASRDFSRAVSLILSFYIVGIISNMIKIFIIIYKKYQKVPFTVNADSYCRCQFLLWFAFNRSIRICKQQHETQTLEFKTKLTCFRHVYLLEPTVT